MHTYNIQIRLHSVHNNYYTSILTYMRHTCFVIARGNLSQVSAIVSLHLKVEHLGLGIRGIRDQVLLQQIL